MPFFLAFAFAFAVLSDFLALVCKEEATGDGFGEFDPDAPKEEADKCCSEDRCFDVAVVDESHVVFATIFVHVLKDENPQTIACNVYVGS